VRQPLSILTVYPHTEAMNRVVTFASGFDHEVKAPLLPVHVVKRGDEWLAFFQRVPMILSMPAYHPEKCSSRDTLEVSHLMTEAAYLADGACVVETDPRGRFTPEIMEHLGFIPRGTHLYQRKD